MDIQNLSPRVVEILHDIALDYMTTEELKAETAYLKAETSRVRAATEEIRKASAELDNNGQENLIRDN